jgi:hypothetical protein
LLANFMQTLSLFNMHSLLFLSRSMAKSISKRSKNKQIEECRRMKIVCIKQKKNQPMQDKLFLNCPSDKWLTSRIYKEFQHINNKKNCKYQSGKCTKKLNRNFSKGKHTKANEYEKMPNVSSHQKNSN